MKKIFAGGGNILLIFLVTVSITIAFALRESNLKGKIVCFGDSITYGASVEGNGWPEQLSKMSDSLKVVNAGRKGRKTSDKNELLPVLQNNKDADYFVFLLGVNDLKDGNDSLVNECVNNMKWMIKETKKEIPNVKIVLMAPCGINLETMSELNRSKKYNQNTAASLIKLETKYSELAENESVGFISLLKTVSSKNYLDGIHPTIAGYAEITLKVWSELNKIFKK